MAYRICKNDGGYYKIQKLRASQSLFGRTIRKEKWVDCCFNVHPIFDVRTLSLFGTIEQAEQQIELFKQKNQKQNKRRNMNWNCIRRIYE